MADQLILTPAQQDLWDQEIAYWAYLQAGEMDRFLALWHDDIMAWPNNQPGPADKSTVRSLRANLMATIDLATASIDILPRAVQLYGDTGVVYYELHLVPAGGAGPETHNRMIHTWQQTADGWQIIGGMSAPLSNG